MTNKFKVGDKVICVKDYTHFTQGEIYKIQNIDGKIITLLDNDIEQNDWCEEDFNKHFEIVPTKKQRITALEKEVSELKLIVHELRDRPRFATVINNAQEPSTIGAVEDVIEFEGQQYKKVDREAREGDVVRYKNTTSGQFNRDNFYKVLHPIAWSEGSCRVIGKDGDDYPLYQRGVGRTSKETDVYELIVDDKPKIQGIAIEEEAPKSPNQQRTEVIEKAKGFVDENGGDDFHFEIDEKERQILAWKIVRKGNGNEAVTGLATCHPNNVYNEHIGKAIALGRALGLDVSEFENAVQPTEPVVGQQIQIASSTGRIMGVGTPDKVEKVNGDFHLSYRGHGLITGWEGFSKYRPENGAKIINDTNAEYEVNA